MAAGVPIIDLDLTPPPADAGPRLPVVRLAAYRPVLLLAVLALVLASLGAAVAPAPRMVRVLWAGGQPAAAFVLGPGALYIAQFGSNPNSESVVRSFSLDDGSLRWSGGLPQNVQNLVLDPVAHVLMGRSGADPRIIFVDSDSGDELWRGNEPNTTVVAMTRGGVLIRTDLSRTETSLRLVDARTGRLAWQRLLPAVVQLGPDDLFDGTATRIVAVGATGHVTVLGWADGAVLSEGELNVRLPADLDPSPEADVDLVSTVGDRLYLSHSGGGRSSLTAYSTVPLSRLWRVEDGTAGTVGDCGTVLCVVGDTVMSGVDPGTGREVWTAPEWRYAYRWDATHLLAFDRQETPRLVMIDPASGRATRRLGDAIALGHLLLHQDVEAVGRTWVSAMDPVDGVAHAIGSLDSVTAFGCSVLDDYVACPTTAGPTGVWLVP